MWTCRHCSYVTTDEANQFCGRCGQARGSAGAGTYDVYVMGFDPPRKINVIKVVREVSGLDLKGAKDLVEHAPQPIVCNLAQSAAEALQAQLRAAGADIEVCPHAAPPSVPVRPMPYAMQPTRVPSKTGCTGVVLVVMAALLSLLAMLFLRS